MSNSARNPKDSRASGGECAAAGSAAHAPGIRWLTRMVAAMCAVIASGVLLLAGCSTPAAWQETVGNDTSAIDRVAARVDQPATEIHTAAMFQAPLTARDQIRLDEISYVDVSLDEVLRVAMTNSDVLRELGIKTEGRTAADP